MNRLAARRSVAAWILAGLLSAVGCVRIQEELTLNADGSGRLRLVYAMSEQGLAQIDSAVGLARQMDASAGSNVVAGSDRDLENPLFFEEDRISRAFRKYRDGGVTLDAVKVTTREGWKYADLTISFRSLDALSKLWLFQDSVLTVKRTPEGNYFLYQQPVNFASDVDLRNPAVMREMAPLLAGFQVTVKIESPARVMQSNALRRADRMVQWDVNVDRDPKAVGQLQAEGLYVVLNGSEITLSEVGARAAKAAPASRSP